MTKEKQMSMAEAYHQEVLDSDPRYLKTLEEEVIKLKRDNKRMRESLETIRRQTVTWTWKNEIIYQCYKTAKEGLK